MEEKERTKIIKYIQNGLLGVAIEALPKDKKNNILKCLFKTVPLSAKNEIDFIQYFIEYIQEDKYYDKLIYILQKQGNMDFNTQIINNYGTFNVADVINKAAEVISSYERPLSELEKYLIQIAQIGTKEEKTFIEEQVKEGSIEEPNFKNKITDLSKSD